MIPLAIRVYLQNKGKRMDQDIERLFEKMCDPNESEAYLFADKLGLKADEEAK